MHYKNPKLEPGTRKYHVGFILRFKTRLEPFNYEKSLGKKTFLRPAVKLTLQSNSALASYKSNTRLPVAFESLFSGSLSGFGLLTRLWLGLMVKLQRL